MSSSPSLPSEPPVKTFQKLVNATETPYPAWAFTTGLLVMLPKALKTSTYRPAKGSIAGFGTATALGGYMIYDNDLINGSGFIATWSALYLLVNGRASIKQLRPGPVALSGLAVFNTVYYGKRFFFPGSTPFAS